MALGPHLQHRRVIITPGLGDTSRAQRRDRHRPGIVRVVLISVTSGQQLHPGAGLGLHVKHPFTRRQQLLGQQMTHATGTSLEAMTDSQGRALEIHEITFDARDPYALAVFWGALLEREIRPGDMPQDDSVLVMPTPGQPGLLFLRVPEGRQRRTASILICGRPRPSETSRSSARSIWVRWC